MFVQTNARLLSFCLTLTGLSAVVSLGQDVSKGYKFDQFDAKTEDVILFDRKVEPFLKALSEAGDALGYVNIYSNDPLAKNLYRLAGPETAKRLVLKEPGRRSRYEPSAIEFWIVPKDVESPFPAVCGLCDCPSLSVTGPERLNSAIEISFTAIVSGGSGDIKYKWTVTGGDIISGQGTTAVRVKPNFVGDIVATVTLSGLGSGCGSCPTEDSFTTAL